MAYQACDTFDHYNTAMLGNVYDSVTGSPVVSSAYARFPAVGSYPNLGVSIPSGALLGKNLKSNQATLIAFLSYGCVTLGSGSPNPIIGFGDSNFLQCGLQVLPTGALQFYNNPGLIGSPSAAGLIAPSSVPNHGIEVIVTFSPTAGSVECWLDGALVIALTGSLKTTQTANSWANQITLGGGGIGNASTRGMYCDYWRVWDALGSYQNAPLGFDVRKLTKLPQGAGALTGWAPNGAAANWQCTDDASPDGDTTYVSANAAATYDSYAMGTSGLTGLPSMVVAKSYVRKDDANTRAIEVGVRSGSSNSLGSPYVLGSSYVYVDACISVDPATGSPATAAAADAYQHLKEETT